MKAPLINDPIWVIVFDHTIKSNSIREKACFYIPSSASHPQISEENQKLALDFLEKMNDSFKEITEAYLSEVAQDETKKPQVEEIREKFKSLDSWIKWLRNWKKPPSESPPS